MHNDPTIPSNNISALNQVLVTGWMPSSGTRGTADILYSSVLTIFLCVWTSIHMNIPGPDDRPFRRLQRKFKWTLLGLFAPEIVLFSAWGQYLKAKDLAQYLNKQRCEHESTQERSVHTLEPFNLMYGFFVVMGGLRWRLPGPEGETRYLTLTSTALKTLAKRGWFYWIDSKELKDRSKADGLAKLLVCAQVSWLSLQCIARKASNLPLTILEIHTFIHVICALAIYVVWFKKPLDIAEAIVVHLSPEDDDLFSLLHLRQWLWEPHLIKCSSVFTETSEQKWFRSQYEQLSLASTDSTLQLTSLEVAEIAGNRFVPDASKEMYLVRYTMGGSESTGLKILAHLEPYRRHTGRASDVSIHELAFSENLTCRTLEQAYRASARARATDVPDDNGREYFPTGTRYQNLGEIYFGFQLLIIQVVILAAYGCFHLAAWNSHFPTKVESRLWRSSGIFLGGGTPILILICAPFYYLFFAVYGRISYLPGGLGWLATLASIFTPIIAAMYIFARGFLVLESFISLRSVPIGVYTAVPWANYLPHI